jgi:BirA family biotin operon repressor/biotin-[acetyl-CoA-carboxylase] ligase
MSYLVSEAVAQAVQRSLGLRVASKWPNDLLVDGKKFCGILLETIGSPDQIGCVAGVGVNVNQEDFPADLTGKATSLKLASGKTVDRARVFCDIMASLEDLTGSAQKDAGTVMMRSWMDRCTTFGRSVQVRGGGPNIEGTALGLSSDGGLIISQGSRTTTVHAGDVTISEPGP